MNAQQYRNLGKNLPHLSLLPSLLQFSNCTVVFTVLQVEEAAALLFTLQTRTSNHYLCQSMFDWTHLSILLRDLIKCGSTMSNCDPETPDKHSKDERKTKKDFNGQI